jgi:hypothetical protein
MDASFEISRACSSCDHEACTAYELKVVAAALAAAVDGAMHHDCGDNTSLEHVGGLNTRLGLDGLRFGHALCC